MNANLTYSPEEVATVAGVTRRTVYAWIKSEKLPAHKVGPKLWVVFHQVLMAFMQGESSDYLRALALALRERRTMMPVRGSFARGLDHLQNVAPVVPSVEIPPVKLIQAVPVQPVRADLGPMIRNQNKQKKNRR